MRRIAARFGLCKVGGDFILDSATLSAASIDADQTLELRERPVTVQVHAFVDGERRDIELEYDTLEFTTVGDVVEACRSRYDDDNYTAAECCIFAPKNKRAAPTQCDNSATLASLAEGAVLQFKLPPRSIKVNFKDGTFVFIGVSEGMAVAALASELGAKRKLDRARLLDFGIFVVDDAHSEATAETAAATAETVVSTARIGVPGFRSLTWTGRR